MKLTTGALTALPLLVALFPFSALAAPQVGEVYEIKLSYENTSKSADGYSNSSASGHTVIEEHVIAIRDDGLILRYDLPASTEPNERPRQWQLPVDILKAKDGTLKLIDPGQLEKRRDVWLATAKIPAKSCGQWYFSWAAFKIECDVQSALDIVSAYRIPENLKTGDAYSESGTLALAVFTREEHKTLDTWVAKLDIDPDYIRRQNAQADVIVGQISRQPVSFDAALEKQRQRDITGSITVTVNQDRTGNPMCLVRETLIRILSPDGQILNVRKRELIERKLVKTAP